MSIELATADTGSVHDATIFLSTVAILISVCVGFVGASILQVLVFSDTEEVLFPSRRTRLGILLTLGLLDVSGVLFPLITLYQNTINGSISTSALGAVMRLTFVIILLNLIAPIVILSMARTFRWVVEIAPPGFTLSMLLPSRFTSKHSMKTFDGEFDEAWSRALLEKAFAAGYIEEAAFQRYIQKDNRAEEDTIQAFLATLKFFALGSSRNATWLRRKVYERFAAYFEKFLRQSFESQAERASKIGE